MYLLSLLFFGISQSSLAQWDNVCTKEYYTSIYIRLTANTVSEVCTGSAVDIEFADASLVFNGVYQFYLINEATGTSISDFTLTLCGSKCSTTVAKPAKISVAIPASASTGNYHISVRPISQSMGTFPFTMFCNTRTFKVVKPLIELHDISDMFGSYIDAYSVGCKAGTWSNGSPYKGREFYYCDTEAVTYTLSCETICGNTIISNPITIKPKPKPIINGLSSFCAGSSIPLTTTSPSKWFLNGTEIKTNSNTLSIEEGGNYQVEVQVSTTCRIKSNEFKVQKSSPKVTITGAMEYCQGDKVTLVANPSGGMGEYKYLWEYVFNGLAAVSREKSVNATQGYSRVEITDEIGCKSNASGPSFRENPRPIATLPILTNLSGTETQAIKAMVSSGTAPYSYAWSAEPNVNFNSNGDNATFGPFTQNTTIKLRVTDTKGCQSDEVRTPLTYVPCTLSAGIQSQSFFFCKGSLPLAATVQNGNDGYTYQWRKDNNSIGGSTSTLDASEGGQYSVIITDKKGCHSASGTVIVTKGNPNVQITGKLEFCAGGSTLLKTSTQNAKAPISYKWQGGSNADSLRVGTVGNYTVEITDAQGCSATSSAVTVIQNPLPIANAGTGKSVTCAETYALTGVSTATGGAGSYRYAWSSSPAVAIQGATTAQPTLGPFVENTTVTVHVTDAKGCVGTAQSTISYIPPDLNVTLTGVSEFCSGKSVPLKATIEKANLPIKQLVWYNGNQEVKRDLNEWTTNQKGYYTVFVEDSKGCRKTSNALTIAENPTPTVTITGSSFFCYSSNTTLSAKVSSGTAPFKHQWQLNGMGTGTDSPTLATASEGSYKLLLTDAKGCTAEAPAFGLVEKGGELIAQITPQGPLSVYAPEKVLLVATLGKEYQYQWKRDNANIAAANEGSYTAEQSGNYTVVVSRGECSRTSAAVAVKVEIPLSVGNATVEEWLFWPNPVSEVLQIKPPQTAPPSNSITIYDVLGRQMTEIKNTSSNHQTTLDISSWPVGQYFIKITSPTYQYSTTIFKH